MQNKIKRGMERSAAVLMALLAAGCGNSLPGQVTTAAAAGGSVLARPNVLVVLVDDLGYSDLSAFGSEIATPHIDALAHDGRILTNFHSTPLCATSRAELLTGADHHLVGVGTLSESNYFYPGNDEYSGTLTGETVAQRLRDTGYHTYMAGKWHLAGTGPVDAGFEQSYSLEYKSAFASNFAPTADKPESAARAHYENGVEATIPDDFFSTDYYTDKLISYIDHDRGDGRPFFAYIAFQAVHFPLQVPDAYLDVYKGRYDQGYAVIRAARIARQKQLGIIPQDFQESPGDEATMIRFGQPGVLTNEPWESLSASDRQSEARVMEIFAGMLTNLDDNIGKLTDHLKQIGAYDNTLIVFMSDNGADGMGYGFIPYVDTDTPQSGLTIDNSSANYGKPSSFLFRSTRWAEVGTAPFRLFKGFTAEGGIGVPALVRLPGGAGTLAANGVLSTLKDVVPTVLELAGINTIETTVSSTTTVTGIGGSSVTLTVPALEGRSLLPALQGTVAQVHGPDDVFADEVNDIRYVRRGPWKMTRVVNYMVPSAAEFISHDWQLYNMDTDRGETTDVAADHPDVVAALTADWAAYVQRVHAVNPVLPPIVTPMDQ